jgi:hypothetical protein
MLSTTIAYFVSRQSKGKANKAPALGPVHGAGLRKQAVSHGQV